MKKLVYFIVGAVSYSLLEIMWRGYTHWTMALLGGIVVMLLSIIESAMPDSPFIFKCVLGTAIITVLEFIFGIVINLRLNLDVWSYSSSPYNILGQICPLFTFFWFLLSILAFLVIKIINRFVFKQERTVKEAT